MYSIAQCVDEQLQYFINKRFNIQQKMDAQNKLQQIKFCIFLHVDATCAENQQLKPCQEVIRLSASIIELAGKQAKLIKMFSRLVKPQCNSKITDFCTKLTGIQSDQLKNQKGIQSVLQQFQNLIKSIKDLTLNNTIFVTWGNWTLESALLKQLKVKKIKIPLFIHSYSNLKRVYSKACGDAKNVFQAVNDMKIESKKDDNLSKGENTVLDATQLIIFLYNNGKFKPNRKNVTVLQDLHDVNVTSGLEYLLVLDFEATCQQNVKLKPCSQIIEFPVMIIDLKQLKVIGEFHHYVTPVHNPKLTKFCTELTGITQEMVDGKLKLEVVLQQLDKWIESHKFLQAKNFTFVTCGDWDLTNCLKNQAKAKNIELAEYLKHYINIKKVFTQKMPQYDRSMGMMGMLKALNIPHQGRHHSGIDDVRNICNVCIGLINKKGLKFTKDHISHVK